MPVVPVRDLLVHPREKDLVVGTYGRGAWIMDVSLLPELTPEVLDEEIYLFNIMDKPEKNYSDRTGWGNQQMKGDNHLRTPNEPNGLEVYYYLKLDTKKDVFVSLLDFQGNEVKRRKASNEKGIHKIYLETSGLRPDPYLVRLEAGKTVIEKPARVLKAPKWPIGKL
jgi:hypothetical protein